MLFIKNNAHLVFYIHIPYTFYTMKKYIKKINQREKELSHISFLFILISDFFVLWLLFFGLSEQIQQLTTVYDYFPYSYRNMLIEKRWVENNIIDNLTGIVLEKSFDREAEKILHPDIKVLQTMIADIQSNTALYTAFEQYDRLNENYEALTSKTKNSEQAQKLLLQVEEEKNALQNTPQVAAVCKTIFEYQTRDYSTALKTFKKWFALKRVLIDSAFLIPLIILLILWNKIAGRKKWSICTEVSMHHIFLSFIPILFEVVRLTIEVFPEELLKEWYDYLLKIKLVSIWYYVVIVLFTGIVIFIIWLFQTKLFTKQKSAVRYYAAGRCPQCGIKIKEISHFCPVCGYAIMVECSSCKQMTAGNLPFCAQCGCLHNEQTV